MSKLEEENTCIAAMENLAKQFLSQPYGGGSTPSDKAMRDEALKADLASYGDRFDTHEVIWLFRRLEQRALSELIQFFALAQMPDPEVMLEHGLPEELVNRARFLQTHNGEQAKAKSASEARAAKQDARAKIAFQKWVRTAVDLETHSGKIQIKDVRGMKGFDTSWGQNDSTLKRWLREAIYGFSFKRGAKKK